MSAEANFRPFDEADSPFTQLRERQRRDRVIDAALQVAIAVLSIAAAYMVATTGPLQRWGFVVGLASQPFWFVATWRARQYGFLLVALFYTGAWVQGVYLRFP